MTNFTSKSPLVLGGSRGIGAEIVRRFTKDGACVTFTYANYGDAANVLALETGSSARHADC